ncbi:unnamed protein product [Protopolystoma xenopodis]|uniref:Uncharacterized protein n=1 Tax=Protopolystoma xenopodis TaxID=117903 RepID=A0A3S5AL31_9PLAT|nr:unnamed protein product [Protopolystoma xenopodis]
MLSRLTKVPTPLTPHFVLFLVIDHHSEGATASSDSLCGRFGDCRAYLCQFAFCPVGARWTGEVDKAFMRHKQGTHIKINLALE